MVKMSTLLLLLLSTVCFGQKETQIVLYHGFNEVELTESSGQSLAAFIVELQEIKVISVRIISHADKAGDFQYNNQLSRQRNLYVLKVLEKQLPSGVHYTTGYFGKDSLLTVDKEGQQQNRRTVITVLYKDKIVPAIIETTRLTPL